MMDESVLLRTSPPVDDFHLLLLEAEAIGSFDRNADYEPTEFEILAQEAYDDERAAAREEEPDFL